MPLLPDALDAGDVSLARWHPGLAAATVEAIAASHAELRQWMAWAAEIPTTADMEEKMARGHAGFDADEEWTYLLVEPGTDAVVGGCGLHPRVGPGGVEIGYWLRTDRTGRGLATAAARALTDAAFAHLDVDRVEIHMDAANARSAAIPRRLGYRLAGDGPNAFEAAATTGRDIVWTVTRAEWPARASAPC